MMTALLFFIFSAVTPVASLLAVCLKGLLFLLNQTIEVISYLPFVVIENIRFQHHHLIGYLFIILAIILVISSKRIRRTAYFVLTVILIMLITDTINYNWKEKRKEIILYNLRNNLAISLIDGHSHMLIVESNDPGWNESKEYLRSYWIRREIEQNIYEYFLDSNSPEGTSIRIGNISMERKVEGVYLNLHKQNMLLHTESMKENLGLNTNPINIDMLLITGSSGFPQPCHYKIIYPEKLVMFGNMTNKTRKAWKKFAESRGIEIYSIYDSGALHEIF
jgi:hypothetical protein